MSPPVPSGPARPNRLIHEKSPYLLQHASNPVDWHPWGDEAFDRARREDKPVFLSIGYSTCHWCHVMERESFEDHEVAALLNEHFVPVKVDREERPDVDRVYMTAMQALGMGGGWPLNVFLTPALEPFFGGTYFPPRSVPGRLGMVDLLPRVHAAWRERRDALAQQGASVIQALGSLAARGHDAEEAPAGAVERLAERAYGTLSRAEDREHGGFGTAPKFPQTVNLDFLFRRHALDPARYDEALVIALRQLDAMRAGGIHDVLGGGFHRYSTDREWLVPHFEKMLYDQAQLAWAYLDGFLLTGREAYAETARGVFAYVARDLTSPEGAFYSAEDADSEGEEGRFYVWTPGQLAAVLPADAAALVAHHYGVTERGNFEHGTSILHAAHPLEASARHVRVSPEAARETLGRARATLLEARSKRVRPHLDDKVLASWNGLMISAFARGARALDDPALLARAARAATFAWERLRDPATGELRRRYRDGEAAGPGQLDDYAYLALGLLDLYRASLDPVWLERAVELTGAQHARFWDDADGGWFDSPANDPHLRLRMKDDYDGAEISGNSIAAANLISLGELLDRRDWRERTARVRSLFAARLESNPAAMPRMLAALESAGQPPRHIVIAGAREAADTRALRREFDRRYRPDDVLLLAEPGDTALGRLAPFTAGLTPRNGAAAAYVCVNYMCQLPLTDPAAFAAQLDAPAATRPTVGEPQ